MTSQGYIRVNDRLQTSAPDVWATGACAGSPQFTHVGEDDCRVVLDNLAGGSRTTRGRLIPYRLFTDPEVTHVGLNETDAKEKSVPYRIARMPMALVLRTRTLSQTRGFMKALVGADDRILGFTAFGAEASELMAVVQTAMLDGLPWLCILDEIERHPSAGDEPAVQAQEVRGDESAESLQQLRRGPAQYPTRRHKQRQRLLIGVVAHGRIRLGREVGLAEDEFPGLGAALPPDETLELEEDQPVHMAYTSERQTAGGATPARRTTTPTSPHLKGTPALRRPREFIAQSSDTPSAPPSY
jgi:Pyridine nucleotide-disulphide oxidoreductase, dimerisation domain